MPRQYHISGHRADQILAAASGQGQGTYSSSTYNLICIPAWLFDAQGPKQLNLCV